MERNNHADLDRWIDERMAPLCVAMDFQPDMSRGLALLRKGRISRASRRTQVWIAGIAVAASLCAAAFPVTRVFASRCVDACAAGIRSALSSPANLRREIVNGKPAPDFMAVDSSGVNVRLSDFRGKVVVLNFWATWCAPCNVETPWLVELQKKYEDAGLLILGASLDDDGWTSVRPFITEKGVSYRTILANRQITNLYGGVDALPATVLIDTAGNVSETEIGLINRGEFETAIRALLPNQSPLR